MTVAGVAAMGVGAGALLMTDNDASAGQSATPRAAVRETLTIKCPDVSIRLTRVPRQAQPTVDDELARMDSQVAQAYQQLATRGSSASDDWVKTRVLEPLSTRRRSAIIRITTTIDKVASRPQGLSSLASCTVQRDTAAPASADANADASAGTTATPAPGGATPAAGGQQQQPQSGPQKADFVDIRRVRPNVSKPAPKRNASKGTFSSRCGRNGNKHFNPDNVIVAPGVSNGAHHMHDYVGNLATDAFSSDQDLAAAGTTCSNGDRSTHYWPVLRLRDGSDEKDLNADGGGKDGNVGRILQPSSVKLTFRGSPVGKVTAMPKFLRIITGDAKSFTNGTANANASWSCTGFENRQLKDKYPLCPRGSDVVRTFNFQSCWDGKNTDSANHRAHVAFAQADGSCAQGFRAVPQLVQRITYKVKPGSVFAVDSFPEQLHKPVTDHGDFINVMSSRLMAKAVRCINNGSKCG
ncbi:DUF1996 domain-containing protein [Streptomyces sp. NPDC048636]|uniref:DUF1996 domain-containing protein n=1 Tax=Streptomyces sp. NPDC048636 TaxID=3155762 RepID=UPI00342960B2